MFYALNTRECVHPWFGFGLVVLMIEFDDRILHNLLWKFILWNVFWRMKCCASDDSEGTVRN